MMPNIGEIWEMKNGGKFIIINTRPLTEGEQQDRYGKYGFQGLVVMADMATNAIQPYHWPAEENLSNWTKVFP